MNNILSDKQYDLEFLFQITIALFTDSFILISLRLKLLTILAEKKKERKNTACIFLPYRLIQKEQMCFHLREVAEQQQIDESIHQVAVPLRSHCE